MTVRSTISQSRSDASGLDFRRFSEAIAWWQSVPVPEAAQPTSSLTGGGAVAALERSLRDVTGFDCALALPSASAALVVLQTVLDVDSEAAVAYEGPTWFGSRHLLAATDAHVWVNGRDDQETNLVVGLDANPDLAVIVYDGRGDAPAGRSNLCAQHVVHDLSLAPVDTWSLAGCGANSAVISFGPGKPVDAGEGGALLLRDRAMFVRAVANSQHPVRRQIQGAKGLVPGIENRRIHPVAALTALHELHKIRAVS